MGETATVRKTSADGGNYASELLFCTTEEGIGQALGQAAGKVLLLFDGEPVLSAYSSPRTVCAVFDGDALPLFSMPDGVSKVLASGKKETLLAARYFAEVRGIPCVLFSAAASLDGVFEKNGEIVLGEKRLHVPLKRGEAVCDLTRMSPTFAEAYARILLVRLAKIETDALNALCGRRLFSPEAPPDPPTEEGLLYANAQSRLAEAEGGYAGEGVVLSRLLKEEPFPCWSAYLMLSALYAAFFAKGKPRRYFTPDYRLRARTAGVPFTGDGIPSAEEYVSRAIVLERVRAEFAKRSLAFLDGREEHCRAFCRWTQRKPPLRCGRTDILKALPEHAPFGLSAVIRDFGLMDWDDDKGRIFARG